MSDSRAQQLPEQLPDPSAGSGAGLDAALLSSNWYRVAALRPQLRAHVRLHRHVYRGQVWHVIEDRLGHRYHRFDEAAYRLIRNLDGARDLATLWSQLTTQVDESTPTQDELIRLIGQLHAADLVRCEMSPDLAELFERGARERRRRLLGRYANPMSIRIRLFDPDRLLAEMVRWLPAGRGAISALLIGTLWCAVVLPALVLAGSEWPQLTRNFSEQVLAADNLLVMALVFPLLKALHELAHGLAVKLRGGEVHDMGLMLIVLYPVPYVDASDSSGFQGKWDRFVVGGAGMAVETFVAALALYLWVLLEPGAARGIAYNVIVLGSVSTVLFNANPLLRYDGYFMLSDAIEIPNLAQRANRLWGEIAMRGLFSMRVPRTSSMGPGERLWLLFYAPLSFVYRLVVMLGIALFVGTQYFFFGTVLALWGLFSYLLMPLWRVRKALIAQPEFQRRRLRVRLVSLSLGVAALVFVFAVPVPYRIAADGVLWLPEQAIVRAQAAGFIESLPAHASQTVSRIPVRSGDAVMNAINPELMARARAQRARVEEEHARWDAQRGVNPARAAQVEETLRSETAALDRLLEEISRLVARAGVDGDLLIERPLDLPGRYLRKGETLGYVVGEHAPVIRVVVAQADVDGV
ncbi:MAG TPA: hypothetical protein PK359_18290, partial [Burkholderiaceae bacterium]|nr:hypothetical protein [Burkholderiaceae bacterium]